MSYLRRIEIRDPYHVPSLLFPSEALSFPPLLALEEYDDGFYNALSLLTLKSSPLDLFDSVTDLIELQKTPSFSSYRRIRRHSVAPSHLLALDDRISALESKFDRLAKSSKITDRKYTWTTEIKGKDTDRKYKFTAEIDGGKKEEKKKKKHHHHHLEQHKKKSDKKNYKWTTEIKEKGEQGPITRTYTWQASTEDVDEDSEPEKKEKKDKKKKNEKKEKKKEKVARIVEIDESSDHGAVVLRHAFAKRAGAIRAAKGKKKELPAQDAAMLIQMSFKAYLVRRSRALRALRELAVAKSKLKEIRVLFSNFSYRRRIVHDAEERQRFTERIIVLLLTVEAIEGADLMVRLSKKSMVDELETMLEEVDPQQPPPAGGKSLSMKRRTFDVPDGVIQKEIAQGVTQIVRMLEQEEDEEDSAASDQA